MTNNERIQARIERDKERKRIKRIKNIAKYGRLNKIFTIQNYFKALKKCLKGVHWKPSVQKYEQRALTTIYDTAQSFLLGKVPPLKWTDRIIIYERGKQRTIVPITMFDRMSQRVICDESIIPMLSGKLIYDNGASTRGKGVHFARKRLEKHLYSAKRKWGKDFYVLVFDFKDFFGSIPHKTCRKVLEKIYGNETIVDIIMEIVISYYFPKSKNNNRELIEKLKRYEGKGICLGSQISQLLALIVPNDLDHFIKDKMSVKHYMRYMDDGFILSNDKVFLQKLYEDMKIICNKLGLSFSDRKTKIVKATKGFTFMKTHYRIVDNKIIKTLSRSGIVRMRRKLKKFKCLTNQGKMSYDDVYNSLQSWLNHAKIANSYQTVRSMMKLYNDLYDGYKLSKKWNKVKGDVKYAILQTDKWNEYRWCCDAI